MIVFWILPAIVGVSTLILFSLEKHVLCILTNRTKMMTWWQSAYHVYYAACCKDFVHFQIDLFIKTDSFLLRSTNCRNSWVRQQQDVDFDYKSMCWSNSDNSDVFDSSDDNNVELLKSHAFSFSPCYTKMKSNLVFDRFCACCQQVSLIYIIRKVHIILNDAFSL